MLDTLHQPQINNLPDPFAAPLPHEKYNDPLPQRCFYQITAGHRCNAAAIRGESFCRHHIGRTHPNCRFDMPVITDRESLRDAFLDIAARVAANSLDCRRAGIILYSLHGALANFPPLPRPRPEPAEPQEMSESLREFLRLDPLPTPITGQDNVERTTEDEQRQNEPPATITIRACAEPPTPRTSNLNYHGATMRISPSTPASTLVSAALTAAVALAPASLLAQTSHPAAHAASAPHAASAAGGCISVPDLSPAVPAVPPGSPCPKALYTLTIDPPAKLTNVSPFETDIAKTLGLEPNTFTLGYVDTKVGAGAPADPHKFLTVKYTGYLADGTVFDASDKHPDTAGGLSFQPEAHSVIPGWYTGFAGMRVGGKRRLIIPYQLAYGAQGRPPVIPAKAELIFDMELISQSDTAPAPKTPPAASTPSQSKPNVLGGYGPPPPVPQPPQGATAPPNRLLPQGATPPPSTAPTTAQPATPPPTESK